MSVKKVNHAKDGGVRDQLQCYTRLVVHLVCIAQKSAQFAQSDYYRLIECSQANKVVMVLASRIRRHS